jgi:HPt (histidine-containing phosphotransfer) domain-containing protein
LDKTSHFDTEALVMLEEIMEEDFPELILVFIEDSDPRVPAMQRALEDKNSLALRDIAHSFKGASSNLSALPLADLCFKVEVEARKTDLESIQLLITAIDAEYQAVKSILLSLIK